MTSSFEAALDLHRRCPPIDLHTDSLLWARIAGYDVLKRHEPPLPRSALFGHADVPRLAEGKLGGLFFGLVAVPGVDRSFADACHRSIDLLDRAVADADGLLVRATTADDLAAAAERGAIAGLLGIEGAHALEGRIEELEKFARRGVRYLGMVHFSKNECATPAFGKGTDRSAGLTPLGRDVIERCEELGLLVDLAHLNARGFDEACAMAKKPAVITHAGIAGVRELWRNTNDAQIRSIAKTGGVIGIMFCPAYLGGSGIDSVCEHLEHLVSVGGEDIAALGSDWDGFIVPTRGLEEPQKLPALSARLLERGMPERVVRKILRENILRVLAECPPKYVVPELAARVA